jgi:Zincin-like metallopeptidase
MSSQEASPSRANAELETAYLCAEAGISNAVIRNQAPYVAGWLKKLRDNRGLVIHAAAQAQHARITYSIGNSAGSKICGARALFYTPSPRATDRRLLNHAAGDARAAAAQWQRCVRVIIAAGMDHD